MLNCELIKRVENTAPALSLHTTANCITCAGKKKVFRTQCKAIISFPEANQTFSGFVFCQTKLNCIHVKFMQIHACNLSRRLTSVPYWRGEGWRANWSWDNQLSVIIYTFLRLSVFSNFHPADNKLGIFSVCQFYRYGSRWTDPVDHQRVSESLGLCHPASWLLQRRLLKHSRA